MPRPEKVQAVADIKERFEGANAVFLAEYAGLSVKEQQELRRSLRQSGAEFKVVKMTLTRLAADELELDTLDELLVGPTGLAFADGDPVTAAKALDDFAKAHEVFVIKGGLLGRDFLAPERVRELASIEPRDVLLARLAGAFQAPMANLARLLAALPRGLATAMSQLIEKRAEEAPPADEAEPAAEEPEVAAPDPAAEEDSAEIPESDADGGSDDEADSADSEAAAEDDGSDEDVAEEEASTESDEASPEAAAVDPEASEPAASDHEAAPDEPADDEPDDDSTDNEDDDETAETAEEE
jgi:large subunit ribosomal protein L10